VTNLGNESITASNAAANPGEVGLFNRLATTVKREWPKLTALVLWLALFGAYWRYTSVHELTPLQTVQQLVEFMAVSTAGLVIYVLLYMLRPVVFFPATLLTLAAGYLYGPIVGVLIVVVASNLSSMVAYFIGRFFGAGLIAQSSDQGVLARYTERLRRDSFETVLVLRFLFLPYDLVSYVCGFLRIDWRGFILATALGSIPGTISFILFGASIEGGFTGELPSLNPWSLAVAVLMFVVSIGLSRWFKTREARRIRAHAGRSL
jgi:uncharacterized membrane protein YdjX (TVP38/TMEM64 family)